MASAVTNLAWGGIVYKDAYKSSGNLPYFLQSLRWAAKWLIRAHPKRYELVVMVSDCASGKDSLFNYLCIHYANFITKHA